MVSSTGARAVSLRCDWSNGFRVNPCLVEAAGRGVAGVNIHNAELGREKFSMYENEHNSKVLLRNILVHF